MANCCKRPAPIGFNASSVGEPNRDREATTTTPGRSPRLLMVTCEDSATSAPRHAGSVWRVTIQGRANKLPFWDERVYHRRGARKPAVTRARSSRHPWDHRVSRLGLRETQYPCKTPCHRTATAVFPCRVACGRFPPCPHRRDSSPVAPHRPGRLVRRQTPTHLSNHLCQARPGSWDNPTRSCAKSVHGYPCVKISSGRVVPPISRIIPLQLVCPPWSSNLPDRTGSQFVLYQTWIPGLWGDSRRARLTTAKTTSGTVGKSEAREYWKWPGLRAVASIEERGRFAGVAWGGAVGDPIAKVIGITRLRGSWNVSVAAAPSSDGPSAEHEARSRQMQGRLTLKRR